MRGLEAACESCGRIFRVPFIGDVLDFGLGTKQHDVEAARDLAHGLGSRAFIPRLLVFGGAVGLATALVLLALWVYWKGYA